MVSGSCIIKTFSMCRDKLPYVINNGLAAYFKELLEEKVFQSCYYLLTKPYVILHRNLSWMQ